MHALSMSERSIDHFGTAGPQFDDLLNRVYEVRHWQSLEMFLVTVQHTLNGRSKYSFETIKISVEVINHYIIKR